VGQGLEMGYFLDNDSQILPSQKEPAGRFIEQTFQNILRRKTKFYVRFFFFNIELFFKNRMKLLLLLLSGV